MLPKWSFTRDEWNHLLRLLNIVNFSMFSCSHFSNFSLIRRESRAPCQREGKKRLPVKIHQWRNQKAMIPAKARPINLVMRSPWVRGKPSARSERPSQSGEFRWRRARRSEWLRKPVRTDPSQDPTDCSQMRRQENTEHADSWKQGWIIELDGLRETCTGGEHKDRCSEHEDHKPSIHDERFPIFAKEVGNHNKLLDLLRWKQQRPMCWNGDRSCLRQWKQPLILDQII